MDIHCCALLKEQPRPRTEGQDSGKKDVGGRRELGASRRGVGERSRGAEAKGGSSSLKMLMAQMEPLSAGLSGTFPFRVR